MKWVHDQLRERLLIRAGVIKPPLAPTLEEIRRTQTCPEFEELRSNRMVMGYFRYGEMYSQPKGKYDNMTSIEKRVKKYRETKNKEYLVDIANICMVEFVTGDGHFESIDNDDVHSEVHKTWKQ